MNANTTRAGCSLLVLLSSLLWSIASLGQSMNTAHTLKLDTPGTGPAASIAELGWLAGSWSGAAFGGTVEEVWSQPAAGAMMGMFKVMHNGQPSMYEFELIVPQGDSLVIKLKHFGADLVGWEEKDGFVSFPLVKVTADGAWFDGLTYLRDGPDGLRVYVALEQDGTLTEELLSLQRQAPGWPPDVR